MRRIEEINAELAAVGEALARRKKLRSAREELQRQCRERERAELESARAMAKEQEDVDKLERMGLACFLACLKGDKEERLSRERREALTAKLRHDQAVRDLEEINARLAALERELGALPDGSGLRQSLLLEKEQLLRARGGEAGLRLARLEEELETLGARCKELGEALEAGRRALRAVERMQEALREAEGLGTWDLLGGGMLATMAKHERLTDARWAGDEVQRCLREFRAELADVSMDVEAPQVEVGEFATFADYFFDGLFADLAVQNQIHASQASVDRTRSGVERTLRRLGEAQTQLCSQAGKLTAERESIVESA